MTITKEQHHDIIKVMEDYALEQIEKAKSGQVVEGNPRQKEPRGDFL